MKNSEEQLSKKVAEIAKLAKQNKNVDTSAMIDMLLKSHETAFLPQGQKMKAYLWSLVFPPAALYYFFKFYFGPEQDAKQAAWVSLILAVVSTGLVIWMSSVIFSANPQLQQIKTITPDQIRELTQ